MASFIFTHSQAYDIGCYIRVRRSNSLVISYVTKQSSLGYYCTPLNLGVN